MRQLDTTISHNRPLKFIAHGLGECSKPYKTIQEYYNDLKKNEVPEFDDLYFSDEEENEVKAKKKKQKNRVVMIKKSKIKRYNSEKYIEDCDVNNLSKTVKGTQQIISVSLVEGCLGRVWIKPLGPYCLRQSY